MTARSREELIEEAQAAVDAETLRHFAEQQAEAVRAAVAAEREACAQIVESAKLRGFCEDMSDAREDLAAQIRERGKGGAS